MILPPSDPQFTGRGFDPAAALRATHPAVPAPTELCAAQHAFLERTRALVSSDEAAQARAEIAATRARWAVRGTAIAHDATSWDAERALARRQLQTRLAAVLAGYAELRKAQRSHFAALFTKAQLPLPALDPHVVLPADPELTQYRSPFSLERRGPLSAGWLNTMQVQDRSFARREIGHLVVDADLSVDPDATWGLNELFGLVPLHQAWLSVACGTVFTPASNGRLMIAAALHNFYSRVNLSLRDEWGLSEGAVSAEVTLFIAALRPDGGEVLHSLVSARALSSDGDDANGELPDIEQRAFNLLAATETAFRAGESVMVLAGVSVRSASALNDMRASVRPLLWWGLDELRIGVIT